MKQGSYSAVRLALALAIAAASISMVNAAPSRSSAVAVNHTWKSDAAEGRRVLEWIASVSPDRAPLGFDGSVTVRTVKRYSRAEGSSSGTPTPPGGLRDTGAPGDEYNVENLLPDGTVQTWNFRWGEPSAGHGGSWKVVGYSYRKGTRPPDAQ